MQCGNLGVECDSNELLGGWLTDLKKGASRATSSFISAAKGSSNPLLSAIGTGARGVGDVYDAATAKAPATQAEGSPTYVVNQGMDTKTLALIGGGLLLVFLVARK